MGAYPVAIVAASAHDPDYVIAVERHELPLSLQMVDLAVGQIVAHQLASFHAKRYEPVAFTPAAYGYGAIEQ